MWGTSTIPPQGVGLELRWAQGLNEEGQHVSEEVAGAGGHGHIRADEGQGGQSGAESAQTVNMEQGMYHIYVPPLKGHVFSPEEILGQYMLVVWSDTYEPSRGLWWLQEEFHSGTYPDMPQGGTCTGKF